MKTLKKFLPLFLLVNVLLFLICTHTLNTSIQIEAEAFTAAQGNVRIETDPRAGNIVRVEGQEAWLAFDVQVTEVGRYRCEMNVASESVKPGALWLEDYYDNKDGRTYNITSRIEIPAALNDAFSTVSKEGCPLNTGRHKMKLHVEHDSLKVNWIRFTLLKRHQFTPQILTQNMTE